MVASRMVLHAVFASLRFALFWADITPTEIAAVSTPMIVMTTMSSTSVNPRALARRSAFRTVVVDVMCISLRPFLSFHAVETAGFAVRTIARYVEPLRILASRTRDPEGSAPRVARNAVQIPARDQVRQRPGAPSVVVRAPRVEGARGHRDRRTGRADVADLTLVPPHQHEGDQDAHEQRRLSDASRREESLDSTT